MDKKDKPIQSQLNNPLHGVKLKDIVEYLVEKYGWDHLGTKVNIRCFKNDPSVKSSLKFLRKTPWAREEVEQLYLENLKFYKK
ncbi:MAG: hypothetical protein ACI87N_001296 [Flavobacteriales bacterium]|jgi:uncharacterized protein (DUF2132 family)